MAKFLQSFLILLCILHLTIAYKILVILPIPSYSHYIVGNEISKALARSGHEVTVIGPYPPEKKIKNYKYIDIRGVTYAIRDVLKDIDFFKYNSLPLTSKAIIPNEMGYTVAKYVLQHEDVKHFLYTTPGKFDAVIFELFNTEAFYGVCHRFEAVCIPLTASGTNIWSNRLTGNVAMASYAADMLTDNSPNMKLYERAYNLIAVALEELIFHLYALPKSDELLHDVLPRVPPLSELIYNTSLVLLNSHPAMSAPLALTPNMKEIGGIHIEALNQEKLSQEVQDFLDKHVEGVTYVALGSNLKSKDLPKEKLREILNGLKKWGKPVLWKFEDDLPEKLENVMTGKWFPQTAVLAHENVKAFVTHCGRLSTMESLYYGVPMVAISIAAEQPHNAAEMEHLGFARELKFEHLKGDRLYDALVAITTNPSYSKEAEIRSRAMRKRNATAEAIYWIEHVIEFEGASYLRHAGVRLPWYKFWMLDVMAYFLILLAAISGVLAYLVLTLKAKTNRKLKSKPE